MGDLAEAAHHASRVSIRMLAVPGGCHTVTASDQVWATDITYIPLQKGILYVVALVDLYSRNVLSWQLSNSLDTVFCLDALEMAFAGDGNLQNFHSDEGRQFTSGAVVERLQAEEIKISWSGRKR